MDSITIVAMATSYVTRISRFQRYAASMCAVGVLSAASFGADAATMELKNDGWVDGGVATFQGGFGVDDEGAVTLGPVNGSYSVDKIRFLFGGSTATEQISLIIYAETGGTNPGPVLYSGDYQLTGANNAIQEVDLTGENIVVNGGSIRVSIKFNHMFFPGIANDADGFIAGRNWIYDPPIWSNANSLGVQGDFIIRAEINTLGGSGGGSSAGGAGTGGDSSVGGSTSSAMGGAGGMSGGGGSTNPTTSGGQTCTPGQSIACIGPGACQGGQVCAADGMSYGECVCGADEPEDEGCGCAIAGPEQGSAKALAALIGMALLSLVAIRRRRRSISNQK